MNVPTPFKLTEAEKGSAVWQRIKPELEKRLTALREQNDRELTPEATATLRGEIKAVKYMLAWEQPILTIRTGDAE